MFANKIAKASVKTGVVPLSGSVLSRGIFPTTESICETVASGAGAAWDLSRIPVARRTSGDAARAHVTALATTEARPEEYERQAKRLQAMSAAPLHLSRSCLRLDRKCSACEESQRTVVRATSAAPATSPDHVPRVVHDVLRSPGKPLDRELRHAMERPSGRDFTQVRVHADDLAATSARAVGARAYTVGRHVVFGAGQFAPGTVDGRRLIAHELAHVVQQGDCACALFPKLTIAPARDASEREADRFAEAVVHGRTFPLSPRAGLASALQRQPCNPADDKVPTGPLPTQLPAIQCNPTEATLSQVRAVPGVSPNVLGVTESGAETDQVQFEELKGSRCKAKLLHAARPIVNFSIYTKEGTYDDGTEQTPATPPNRPCAGKTVARKLKITGAAAAKLKQGEAEHCNDAKLAFALSWGKFNQASKDLEGEYCAAGVQARGNESICDKEFARRFTARTGIDWTKRADVANCLFDKSKDRDTNHWHDVVPVDSFYAKDCSAITYIYAAASAPEVGRHSSADVVKGCGEK